MTNKDLFEALRTFEKEKGIPMDYMLQNIEKAISVACRTTTAVMKMLYSRLIRKRTALMQSLSKQ